MPSRPLGPKQRELLVALSHIDMALATGDALSDSLVRRGLLATHADGGFVHITAAGLRALADEIDAGRVALFTTAKLASDA